MSEPMHTAKAKLVIVVGPSELSDHLARDIRELGARGFTFTRANGHGAHGDRTFGILDGANGRFEIVASPALAAKILDHVATQFGDRAVIAYALDCEAVPFERFV